MKGITRTLVCTAVAGFISVASAAAAPGSAAEFVNSLGEQVISILNDDDLSHSERVARFRTVLRQTFDIDQISSYVLGGYQEDATPEQAAAYRKLFGRYVSDLYAMLLTSYSGEKFVVTGEQSIPGRGSLVTAQIRRTSGESLRLAFETVRTQEGHKIYDVTIEGISLLVAKRREVASIVERNGISGLIASLEKATQMAKGY